MADAPTKPAVEHAACTTCFEAGRITTALCGTDLVGATPLTHQHMTARCIVCFAQPTLTCNICWTTSIIWNGDQE